MPMEPTLESFAELAAQVYEATGRTQDTLVGKDALRNLLRAYGLDLSTWKATAWASTIPSTSCALGRIAWTRWKPVGAWTWVKLPPPPLSTPW